jgi:hypothetical protein
LYGDFEELLWVAGILAKWIIIIFNLVIIISIIVENFIFINLKTFIKV